MTPRGSTMTIQDKKETRQIFNEGVVKVIMPVLDDILKNMATKKDIAELRAELKNEISETREDLSGQIDIINRKLDAEIAWRDDASKRLKRVEVGIAK